MPRQAPYRIQWSVQAQAYEILSRSLSDPLEIVPGSLAWTRWLDNTISFAFYSQSGGYCTARKEMIQRSGTYWYGYRSLHGRTVKRYLGRTADLSIARLEEIVASFTDELSSQSKQIPSPSPAQPSSLLLTSKFHPPRLPLGLVERPQLFSRLDTWHACKLTLLSAPAGFGKTTLMSAWVAESYSHPNFPQMAWVSLDARDNDPVHFWHSVIIACQIWQAETGKKALAQLLSALQPPFQAFPLEAILTLFLNDLASRESESVLILDDYHAITEPRLHESMAFFLEHLPPHFHVVILTRNEPPLPLIHWRAQGFLREIHTTDLRFSTEETAAFLQQMTASSFSETTTLQINRLLEGWPAGLRLLTLAGQLRRDGVERHLSALSLQHSPDSFGRQLLDYFVSEVLNAQPGLLQLFLLQTSVLPRLTGSLCEVVTGRQNSATLLETIERAGLFLEALDEREAWYRYPPLFAEIMHMEASRRLGEETLCEVARRASFWYEQHGLLLEATQAALDAHDAERAGMLIEQAGAVGQRYELSILRRFLTRIPHEVLCAHPTLCLYSALTLQFLQGTSSSSATVQTQVEEWLQRAEEGWQSSGHLPWIGLIFAFRALIASLDGRVQVAVRHAKKALALLPEEDPHIPNNILRSEMGEWRIICLGIVGEAEIHQGHFDKAWHLLREALVYSQESSTRPFSSEILLRMGAISSALGELHQASEYHQQALSSAREREENNDAVQAMFGLAQISLEWNDLETTEQWINEILELMRQSEQTFNERSTYLLTLLLSAQGQTISAQQHLATLLARLQVAATPQAQELLPDALALQTRLQLAMGDLPRAERSLSLLASSERELSFVQRITASILQARLQLARSSVRSALFQLEQLRLKVSEKRYMRGELEITILLALTLAACKKPGQARRWLRQALLQAKVGGFLQVFLAEGQPLALLLRSLLPGIREQALQSTGQAILLAFAHAGENFLSTPSASDKFPLEPLSMQEQRVLRLLCAGLTNAAIADELVISVNTVKDHVKHLYYKLGVSKRLEACEAARRLEQS